MAFRVPISTNTDAAGMMRCEDSELAIIGATLERPRRRRGPRDATPLTGPCAPPLVDGIWRARAHVRAPWRGLPRAPSVPGAWRDFAIVSKAAGKRTKSSLSREMLASTTGGPRCPEASDISRQVGRRASWRDTPGSWGAPTLSKSCPSRPKVARALCWEPVFGPISTNSGFHKLWPTPAMCVAKDGQHLTKFDRHRPIAGRIW